jgi:hypothetical protein
VAYQLASNSSGVLIYTDQEDAIAEYTWRITNADWYPPDFVSALAWRLAPELAMALAPGSLGSALRDKAFAYYKAALIDATAATLNEETNDEAPPSEFIRERE